MLKIIKLILDINNNIDSKFYSTAFEKLEEIPKHYYYNLILDFEVIKNKLTSAQIITFKNELNNIISGIGNDTINTSKDIVKYLNDLFTKYKLINKDITQMITAGLPTYEGPKSKIKEDITNPNPLNKINLKNNPMRYPTKPKGKTMLGLNVSKVVNDPYWKKIKKQLKGTWTNPSGIIKGVHYLRTYLSGGNFIKAPSYRIVQVTIYITGNLFRFNKVSSPEIDKLKEDLHNEFIRRNSLKKNENILIKNKSNIFKFIIQEHDAKRANKHYDLRIEKENKKLQSWALKNLPDDNKKKVLAVRTPDHPASWYDFEGQITSKYGEGSVQIYDKGLVKVKRQKNKILFEIIKSEKNKFHGRYSLIHINIETKNWLLVKMTNKINWSS